MGFFERHKRRLLGFLIFVLLFLILIRLVAVVADLFGVGLAFLELPLVVVLALAGTWIALKRFPTSARSQPKP